MKKSHAYTFVECGIGCLSWLVGYITTLFVFMFWKSWGHFIRGYDLFRGLKENTDAQNTTLT